MNELTPNDIRFLKEMKKQGVSQQDAFSRLEAVKQKSQQTAPQSAGAMLGSAANKLVVEPLKAAGNLAIDASKVGGRAMANAMDTIGLDKGAESARENMNLDVKSTQEKVLRTGADIGLGVVGGALGRSAMSIPAIVNAVKGLGLAGKAGAIASAAPGVLGESVGATTAISAGRGEGLPTPAEVGLGIGADLVLGTALGKVFNKTIGLAEKYVPKVEALQNYFVKAVRPSVGGKKGVADYDKFMEKATDAVTTITQLKPALKLTGENGELITGKLPENLMQFSESINQAKELVFAAYDRAAKESGEQGVLVDIAGVVDELGKLGASKVQRLFSPKSISYAQDLANQLNAEGPLTPLEAQQAIQLLNKRLEGFYRNPTPEGFSTASVDAILANNLRKNLDETIESSVGGGYQALKNKYGSLKTIEKDVINRAIVDARKNNAGLIDFTDIFTVGDFARAFATQNPGALAGATAQTAYKKYLKLLNDPNVNVKKMFQEAEQLFPGASASHDLQNTQDGIEASQNKANLLEELPQISPTDAELISALSPKLQEAFKKGSAQEQERALEHLRLKYNIENNASQQSVRADEDVVF